ncbi:MAG: cytochrome c peroxidase [Polyangiales bacterium]
MKRILERHLVTLAMIAAFCVGAASCKKAEEVEPEAASEAVAVETVPVLPPAPSEFPAMPISEDNPQTIQKALLGYTLFFDPRLSVDGSRSCYSCHQNEHGNGGGTPLAVGAKGKQLTRHSPVIWNVAYFDDFYWDGRADSLEAQAKGAWGGGNMGVGKENLDKKARELSRVKGYKDSFDRVFPGEGMTPDTIAKAIAAYERTLVCNNTAYDRYAKGAEGALTAKQKEGWEIFMGKGQCVVCHAPPMFSSAMGVPGGVYYNVGIGTEGVPEEDVDIGRAAVTENDADWAAFKVPSLRNAAKSAPYFHDGSVATLKEAVTLMATGGIDNKNKTTLLADRGLTPGEIDALVAFLGALNCKRELEVPELPE